MWKGRFTKQKYYTELQNCESETMPIKKLIVPFLLLVFSILSCSKPTTYNVAYLNGQWFNGDTFFEKTLFSIDGYFTDREPSSIDTTIDLTDKYIISPFGDAHTHNLGSSEQLDEMVSKYVDEGIFYVQVLTNHASKISDFRDQFNQPGTLDVIYANGGLTATLGHPFVAFETSALGLHWSAMFTQRDKIRSSRLAENDAYWFLDSPKEVQEKWDSILASNPDILKIYLIRTSEHDELFNSGNIGNFGLSSETARAFVKKAKEENFRVIAHVETADDFRVGLDIGVDGFGHLPGYSWDGKADKEKYKLTDEDLRRAAEANVYVTPTVNFARIYATTYDDNGTPGINTERLKTVNQFLKTELLRLYEAGVNIAIGADQLNETSLAELHYIHKELNAFDNATLLRLATYTTPKSIFPDRLIGKFENEYEASFLALDNNPLIDWSSIQEISMRVKEGIVLDSKEKLTIK